MPTTRSASRAAAAPAPEPEPAPVKKRASTKRKAPDSGTAEKVPRKRAAKASPEEVVEKAPKKRAAKKSAPESAPAPAAAPADWTIPPPGNADTTEVLPAKLTFSFEDAKKHLISVDARFKDVFRRLRCRPYEEVEPVEPFATLATSILGQQISWLAARSVRHKFIRLYFPELPEKADEMTDEDGDKFPTPYQVAQTPISILRTAGLSGRKAEYIQDLASRFDDGRLSSRKVFEVEDEELYEMLIAVRGIGRWTVDMFAMFALRRPDIMPSGDLGVQRGVLRWFLAMHSPEHPVAYSPKKLPNNGAEDETQETKAEGDDLPTFGDASENEALATPPRKLATLPDEESQATEAEAPTPAPAKRPRRVAPTPSAIGLPSLPPALTPSFNTTLVRTGEENGVLPTPLPVGLTVAEMKARLSGKKKVKGQLATPAEMEALTESWKPYRSLGAYFMWALAEDTKGK